jgi:hypothetical protein
MEEEILTPEQEKFCRNYTQNKEFFSNATLAYADAYGFDLDAQAKDDAQYQNRNGEVYAEYEFDENGRINEIDKRKCKKIQESSYQRMYNNVATYASKTIKKMHIQKRCRVLLNEMLNDEVIDARLAEIILKGNHADSLRALQEYNKLRQRIITKIDHTSKGNEIKGNTIIFTDFKDEGTETNSQ